MCACCGRLAKACSQYIGELTVGTTWIVCCRRRISCTLASRSWRPTFILLLMHPIPIVTTFYTIWISFWTHFLFVISRTLEYTVICTIFTITMHNTTRVRSDCSFLEIETLHSLYNFQPWIKEIHSGFSIFESRNQCVSTLLLLSGIQCMQQTALHELHLIEFKHFGKWIDRKQAPVSVVVANAKITHQRQSKIHCWCALVKMSLREYSGYVFFVFVLLYVFHF